MKHPFAVLACAAALLAAACSRQTKEVPPAVAAEAKMHISEAQFAIQIREFKRAEELVRRALELRDDVPEYWVTLGMVLRRQDDVSGARKAYEKALALHVAAYKAEKKPEDLGHQAFVLGLLGRKDEAFKLLDKGIKDHPDSTLLKKMADPRGYPRTFESAEFKALAI